MCASLLLPVPLFLCGNVRGKARRRFVFCACVSACPVVSVGMLGACVVVCMSVCVVFLLLVCSVLLARAHSFVCFLVRIWAMFWENARSPLCLLCVCACVSLCLSVCMCAWNVRLCVYSPYIRVCACVCRCNVRVWSGALRECL